jgi:hypothetical protein
MKNEILKLSTVVLLLLFMGTGCQKDEIELDDESIEISSYPHITIYKFKGDYIHLIAVGLNGDGKIVSTPAIIKDNPKMRFDSKGRMIYAGCHFLKDGYVLGGPFNLMSAITDITIKEYLEYDIANEVGGWPEKLIIPRIVDKDPISEFYYLDGLNKREKKFTLGEINKMIEDGTLETVFKKLK